MQRDAAEAMDMVPAFTNVSRAWWGDADWGWSGNGRQERPWGAHVRWWIAQQDAAIQAVSIAAPEPMVSCPKQKRSRRIVRARWILTIARSSRVNEPGGRARQKATVSRDPHPRPVDSTYRLGLAFGP